MVHFTVVDLKSKQALYFHTSKGKQQQYLWRTLFGKKGLNGKVGSTLLGCS